ncbi:MAG: HAMP domain-containing histidine kinase [Acidimicrobiia bacterium]|nr:HAMP domain-containing histidine kinase [Acidimicrobiia bacterium]
MRRRVLAAMLAVTALAVVLFGVPLAFVLGRLLDEGATLRIEREAVEASRSVPADFASSGDPVELPESSDGVVFGLYDSRGDLVAGKGPSRADAVTEQAMRDEVADAEVGETRVVAIPLAADEQVIGAVRAEQSTQISDARTRRFFGLLVSLAVAVLTVALVVGSVVAGRLVRPVLRIRDAAVRLGDGDFAIEVPSSGFGELDEAGEAMVVTAQRLDRLIARERMFTSDVSHQLRTPLAGLRVAIETELAFPRADPSQALEEALGDIDRLDRTVADLLTFARTAQAVGFELRVSDVLTDLKERWRRPFAQAGRQLQIGNARFAAPVRGSGAALGHALDVLVANALEHGEGVVAIDVRVSDESVTLEVVDEGPGFSASPFERGPGEQSDDWQSRRLGLSLARRLVESLPGRLTVIRLGPCPQIDVILQRVNVDDSPAH